MNHDYFFIIVQAWLKPFEITKFWYRESKKAAEAAKTSDPMCAQKRRVHTIVLKKKKGVSGTFLWYKHRSRDTHFLPFGGRKVLDLGNKCLPWPKFGTTYQPKSSSIEKILTCNLLDLMNHGMPSARPAWDSLLYRVKRLERTECEFCLEYSRAIHALVLRKSNTSYLADKDRKNSLRLRLREHRSPPPPPFHPDGTRKKNEKRMKLV